MLGAAAVSRAAVQTVTIGDLYDGGTVAVASGDTLEVRLSASPSGCAWSLAFGEPRILKPEEGGTPGSPIFRFKAVATGSASLGLACLKPSDPKAPPGGLFRVLVVVKEAWLLPRALVLEEPDNGSDIFLAQGDMIAVKLPANPSTGYSWTIAANTPSVLQPAGDPRFEPPARAVPGAGGTQTFEFRVVGGGGAFLQLVYRRPFEKESPPARQWGVFVAAAGVGP